MSQLKGILNQHKKIGEYNQATLALIHNYFYVSALIKSCKLFIPFSTPTPLAFFSHIFPFSRFALYPGLCHLHFTFGLDDSF